MNITARLACTVAAALLALSGQASAQGAKLPDAAKRRDAAAVAAMLKGKVDVDSAQPDGATALHWAAHWNDVEMARSLIRAKARVDATNEYGVTPLLLACADAGRDLVDLLLRSGANPNLAQPDGETPLMAATRVNNLSVVKLLLAHRAEVNAKQEAQGQTALMWAFSRNHLDIARTLIDAGADIRARSAAGFTPLMFAARQGGLEAVQLLLGLGADVNDTVKDGASVLHLATVRGHAALAEFLLAKGANPNASGPGYTPLHWAVGTWESVTTTEYVASPPQASEFRAEWASLGGIRGDAKLSLIKALLAHGADPNARTTKLPPRFGYSFSTFVRAGGSAVGATPFIIAAAVADVPVMRLLLAGGADPRITTKDGSTALMVASGMTSIEEEHTVPEARHLEAVKLVLASGADVNAKNEVQNTALHAAALLGYPTIAEYLVTNASAEVNPVNGAGETPLRLAEGTIINAMFFIHEPVAVVLRKLGGITDGSGVCTGGILKNASVTSTSTLCDTAKPALTPTLPPQN